MLSLRLKPEEIEYIKKSKLQVRKFVAPSPQGKLLAICTALLGATHGVTFVAIVLQAMNRSQPVGSQE
jgi:hypothetical protein